MTRFATLGDHTFGLNGGAIYIYLGELYIREAVQQANHTILGPRGTTHMRQPYVGAVVGELPHIKDRHVPKYLLLGNY